MAQNTRTDKSQRVTRVESGRQMTWVNGEEGETQKAQTGKKLRFSLYDEQILILHISPKGAQMKPDGTDFDKDPWIKDFNRNDPEEHDGDPTSDSA